MGDLEVYYSISKYLQNSWLYFGHLFEGHSFYSWRMYAGWFQPLYAWLGIAFWARIWPIPMLLLWVSSGSFVVNMSFALLSASKVPLLSFERLYLPLYFLWIFPNLPSTLFIEFMCFPCDFYSFYNAFKLDDWIFSFFLNILLFSRLILFPLLMRLPFSACCLILYVSEKKMNNFTLVFLTVFFFLYILCSALNQRNSNLSVIYKY